MDRDLLNFALNTFERAFAQQWGPVLEQNMLLVLQFAIGLQILLVSIDITTSGDSWGAGLMKLALGILRPMLIWWLFAESVNLANGVIAFGIDLGQRVSGMNPALVTPSGVFNEGLNIMSSIMHAKSRAGWIESAIQSLEFFFVSLTVACLWGFAAIIYLYTLLQAAVMVYGGFLVIGFSPIGWVADFAVRWAVAVLGSAIKIVAIMMVLATGVFLANQWSAELAGMSATMSQNMWHLIIAIFMSLLLLTAVWQIPNYFMNLIGVTHHFNFGEALAAAAMGRAVAAGGGALMSAGAAAMRAADAGLAPLSETVQGMLMET